MNGIWIAWEKQRRTTELAAELGVDLRQWTFRAPYLLRIIWLSFKTCVLLIVRRPPVLIVQNPSVVLAALAALLKPLLGYKLVVDRHSNFKLETSGSRSAKYRIFHFLSRYSLPRADLTIVTNEFLRDLVDGDGGRGVVLPDKIPNLPFAAEAPHPDRPTVVFVASHSPDEPTAEFIEAARILGPGVDVRVTGDEGKLSASARESAPPNLTFTGFLSDRDFQMQLGACDVVVVLTTKPHILLCGAYEAVAAGKPLVLSNQEDLLEYFSRGVVPTENDADGIAVAIRIALADKGRLSSEIEGLKVDLTKFWDERMDKIRSELAAWEARGHF